MNLFPHFRENCRQQPYFALAASLVLLLFMVLLSNVLLFLLLPIFDISLAAFQLLMEGEVETLSPKVRGLLLVSQGLSQLLTWGLVGAGMMHLAGLPMQQSQKLTTVLRLSPLAILWLWSAIPLVQVLTFRPENFHLPAFLSFLEEYIKSQEGSRDTLVQVLLQTPSPFFLICNLLVMALLPAICEELLFRGFLQQLLYRKMKVFWAIVVSSFVFSAVHFQFLGFLPRFLLGLMLGYLFYRSRHLFTSILAHFAFNAVTIVVAFYSTQSKLDFAAENYQPPLNLLLISVLFLLLIFWQIRKE